MAIIAFTLDANRPARPGAPSLQSLLFVYIAGGSASGLLIAFLHPLTRYAVGRVFVAAIAAFPVSALVMLMTEHWRWRQVDRVDVGIAIALALLFGPFAMAYGRIRLGGESPNSDV